MKLGLDRGFDPPAPMVPVRVSAPSGADSTALDGKLDTGADLCAVPDGLIEDLDLPPVRTVRAASFSGTLVEAIVYRIDLTIGSMAFPHVEALVTRRSYVIVGRNVLRHVIVRVDGPREQLEIRMPRGKAQARKPRHQP